MTEGLVSVIVPTHNRASYLGEALESALSQSLPEGFQLEVVVVDDGSRDGSEQLIRSRFAGNSKIRYFFQENQGVSAARNRALAESRGEWIAFLDSDDLWLPGKLSLQLRCIRDLPNVGMIWTDMDAIDSRGHVVSRKFLRQLYRAYRYYPDPGTLFSESRTIEPQNLMLYWGDIFSAMVTGNLVHTSTVLLKRERLLKVGEFREDYRSGGEDYEFYLRVCREGPVAFIDTSTLQYRVGHPDALTRPENNSKMAEAFLETLLKTIEEDGKRIQLPLGRLESCLADAYAWAGRELLVLGDGSRARQRYLQSLRLRPWQPSQLRFIALLSLPSLLRNPIIRAIRNYRN